MAETKAQGQEARMVGLVWDDDLSVCDNPIPAWWVAAFCASIAFAVAYWIIFPSWPLGEGFLPGIARVTYTDSEGRPASWHWNARAQLLKDAQDAARAQQAYLDRLGRLSFQAIEADPDLMRFVMARGRSLFANYCGACHPMVTSMQRTRLFSDNCAVCHTGGVARIGAVPKVADDPWIFGGTHDRIRETITRGRRAYMPPFSAALEPGQIDELAHYVLSLSGSRVDPAKAARGDKLFHSHAAACFYCHGDQGQGRQDIGAANLTDDLWLWTSVPIQPDTAGKVAAVARVIADGLGRGVMPAWGQRLTAGQITALTVYVHERGRGK